MKRRIVRPGEWNLRTKLLMVLLIVSLIPLGVSAWIYYKYAVSAMAKELGASSVTLAEQVQDKTDAFFKELLSVSNMISYNPDVQYLLQLRQPNLNGKTLAAISEVERQLIQMNQYRQLLSTSSSPYNDFKGIFLYTDENILVHNILENVMNDNYPFQQQDWFRQISASSEPILIPEHIQSYVSNQPVVTFARRLTSSRDFETRGALFIDISPSLFERDLSDIRIGKTGYVFLMDANGQPLYKSERFPTNLMDDPLLAQIRQNANGSITQSYNGAKTLISYTSSHLTGLTTVVIVPWSEIGEELRETIRMKLIILLLIAAAIMVVVADVFSRRLTVPILRLKNAMRSVESGNVSVRIPVDRRDEFGVLSEHFNNMLRELDALQQEVLQTRMREFQLQLHKKDSELVALRAQINPHFLYNTLNTMSCIGEVHNVEEVTILSRALGDMFQYSSTGEHYSTLWEEIKHVGDYFTIMKMRYHHRYEYHVSAPEELHAFRVVKMMLQPLVENAFQHGLERKANGRVDIVAAKTDDELIITVRDDGAGMDKGRLAKVLALLNRDFADERIVQPHIGLYNVQKRLQLHYEGRAYLNIASEAGRGTAVSIHIPYTPDDIPQGR